MAKKEVAAIIKLQIPAGKATPAPPVGPALGPHGVPAPMFCQQFNDRTREYEPGLLIPVVISAYKDRSFSFTLKTPPASELIKRAIGLKKGSANSVTTKIGTITEAQLREIAETKMVDLSANDVEEAIKIIAGTARSMGVVVEK